MTLALYRRRAFRKKVCASKVLWRAFDKAVRRKPPGVAADAGPMQIQWREGAVSRCAGAVPRSAEDDTARPRAGRSAKRSLTESLEKRKEEIGSAARRRGTERDDARKVFVLWTAVSCGSRDQDRWRTELDLGGSKSFEDHHRPATLGTEPKRARFLGSGCFLLCLQLLYRAEQLKAKRQERGASPIGEEAEVPDADEALRKHVQQEAA